MSCTCQRMLLPMEIVYHIRDYLRWRERATMVSREWLFGTLRRRMRLRAWRSKMRMFSYIKVFGQVDAHMSWACFCQQIGVIRRARNRHYRLTWRAAATRFMQGHCKVCGRASRSNVFGIPICVQCRFNPRWRNAYMVMTRDARNMGVPKRILDKVPYHSYGMCHLRFLHEIQECIHNESLI